MWCPQCQSTQVVPVTKDGLRLYCPKCRHTWMKGKEQESLEKNEEGTLNFEGVPQVKELMKVLDGAQIDPASKMTFGAQLTTVLYDQWFEGFKTGLLADFVNKKDLEHGKDSFGPEGSNRQHPKGDSESGISTGEDSKSREPSSSAPGGIKRVKERICGIEVTRPANITLTEDKIADIAHFLMNQREGTVQTVDTDGVVMKVAIKL